MRMIRDAEFYNRWDREQRERERLTPEEAFAIADALWAEGVALGVLPPKDPLEGIDTILRVARIVNSCSSTRS